VVLLACLGASAAQAAAPYRGRSVDAVLDELATAANVQLVYTSAVIPATATVTAEPSAGPAIEVIAQVLAPLGLKLQRIQGRIYSIAPKMNRSAHRRPRHRPRRPPPARSRTRSPTSS